MNIRAARRRLLALLWLLAAALPAAQAAGRAEYAIRWNPAAGGPASARAVFAALGLKPDGDTARYVVRYYGVPQPAGLPPGYSAIARERTAGSGERDATYKLRGPDPPPPGALDAWRCPLAGKADTKREVDVGWTAGAAPQRAYSASCTAATAANEAFPKALGAIAGSCTSRMERSRAGTIKLESWTFPNGSQVFEVSTTGPDEPGELARFQSRIVEPLLREGAQPLGDSKTGLGSTC